MPTTQQELTTTPFYRWFILNAIHKRNFKDGQLAGKIPWIPSGVGAWKLESVLSIMAESALLSDDEKEIVTVFFREYERCLSRGDDIMTDEFCLGWDKLKRMFDLNDPEHIAYQSMKRLSEQTEGDKQLYKLKADVEQVRGRKEAPKTVQLKMQEDGACQEILVLEGKAPATPRGKKRVVSGTAERSVSPTKKNKPIQIQVSELGSDSSSSSESVDSYCKFFLFMRCACCLADNETVYRFKDLDLDVDGLNELHDTVPLH
jgi:hypothetical protein